MDDFKRAGAKSVGIGGVGCPCCFDYKNSRGKKKGFSRIRRSRFKQETTKMIKEDQD